ncbi:MAG: trypsin-like peptidase domain-containing protein [Vitreoscilla sp.]
MKNLQEATERICELKGSLIALDSLLPALIEQSSAAVRASMKRSLEEHAEAARTVMLHADISELALASFERDIARNLALLERRGASREPAAAPPPVEALLMATSRVTTFFGSRVLTSASGFFFRRDDRLFIITNRHVFIDADNAHFPDRIELGVHTDARDLTRHATVSLPLYQDGLGLWRDAKDSGGEVDVAALEIPASALPADAVLQAFDTSHLEQGDEIVQMGDALAIVGFPLGFHDTIHHLAVSRSASVASAFGVRFQQKGWFLTDARTHRGSSGAPVVRRRTQSDLRRDALPWQLLGIHSTRMDMKSRDKDEDESLGLNCAWYADVLLALTESS